MARFFLLICSIIVIVVSCRQKYVNDDKYLIEIIKVGLPQYIDTNNFSKVGGIIYARYDENSDSIFIKTCMTVELMEQGIYPSDSLPAKYFYCKTIDSLKEDLKYFIKYLKPIKDGRLPNNYRDPELIGCNLLGTWIAVLTDQDGKRHYYNFAIHNLPIQVGRLCETIYMKGYVNHDQKEVSHLFVNTDSLVGSILQLKSMDSIELFPQHKTKIKFTPPEMDNKN